MKTESISSLWKPLLIAALCFLTTAPAWAYIVFLKDGTQITTQDKYRVDGDKAFLTLPSGTETVLDLAEIDVAKTEELNKINLGTARVVEGRGTRQMEVDESFDDEVDRSLGKLINSRSTGLSLPDSKTRSAVNEEGQMEVLPTTDAGFVDLMKTSRRSKAESEIGVEILTYLQGQGVDEARVYEGTAPDRVLVEAIAASEASVFKVLKDSANALVQVHGRFPQQLAALELLLVTETQVRAGQFVLTPDLANQLSTGAIDPPTFFYRYVEF